MLVYYYATWIFVICQFFLSKYLLFSAYRQIKEDKERLPPSLYFCYTVSILFGEKTGENHGILFF